MVVKLRLTILVLAIASVTISLVVPTPSDAAPSRAFVARARAFPVEPDPGQNDTSFSMRPVAAELGIANPPVSAFGRASVFDAGFAENQFADEDFPPDESFARCDTVSPNVPDTDEQQSGPFALSAECSEAPAGTVQARGVDLARFGLDGGSATSTTRADGSGDTVWAESTSVATGVTVGPLTVDELRFTARAEAGGDPGSTAADSSISVVGAEVAGVPVIVGSDGVVVDESAVPTPFVAEATAAVREAFAQGGYVDLRLVHPEEHAAPDGTSARVSGGVFEVFLQSSDDPADREFLGLTLLGGRVEVEVGDTVDDGAVGELVPFAAGGSRVGGVMATRPSLGPAAPPTSVDAPTEVTIPEPAAAAAPRVDLATASVTRAIAGPSSAWIVALVVGLAGLALVAISNTGPLLPARRRVEAWWEGLAEGFLRG